jgi:hypothetical protein
MRPRRCSNSPCARPLLRWWRGRSNSPRQRRHPRESRHAPHRKGRHGKSGGEARHACPASPRSRLRRRGHHHHEHRGRRHAPRRAPHHRSLLRRKIAYIGSDANDFARTNLGEFLSCGIRIFLAAAGDGHIEAFFEQAGGDAVADAFAAPGDEGGHLVEIVHMVVNVGSSEMVEIV